MGSCKMWYPDRSANSLFCPFVVCFFSTPSFVERDSLRSHFFRCDSISKQLPLSMGQSVSGALIVSDLETAITFNHCLLHFSSFSTLLAGLRQICLLHRENNQISWCVRGYQLGGKIQFWWFGFGDLLNSKFLKMDEFFDVTEKWKIFSREARQIF